MRAFTLDSFGAAPALRSDVPEPRVGDDDLLVRVHASSVNPVDVFIAAGGLQGMAEHEFPVPSAACEEPAGAPSRRTTDRLTYSDIGI